MRFYLITVPFLALIAGCASTTYAPRPYRFESPATVPQETQRIAQRMAGDTELRPAFVDPSTGTVLAPWRITGVSASVQLLPPGERRSWVVKRYRAFVRPNGWGSSVFIDVEAFECETRGFGWSALELRGDCRPINQMTDHELQALDAKAASLRG